MFQIIKRISGFWHNFNSGSKEVNLSDFNVILDTISQTYIVQSLNGSNIPNSEVAIANIEVIDETDASIVETFTTVELLKERLFQLGYTPYLEASGLTANQKDAIDNANAPDASNPFATMDDISGGGATWGGITGTISAQTDLQTALNAKVDENASITGATKTKVTYDAKGLITSGTDATTADIADSTDKRYQTDVQQSRNDATSSIQTQLNSKENIISGIVASGTNTYIATYSPTIAYTDGLKVIVRFTNANSGASTININGLGAKSIVKGVSTALVSGDIISGATLLLVYNGSAFVAVSGLTVSTLLSKETFTILQSACDLYGVAYSNLFAIGTFYSIHNVLGWNTYLNSGASVASMTNNAALIVNASYVPITYISKLQSATVSVIRTEANTTRHLQIKVLSAEIDVATGNFINIRELVNNEINAGLGSKIATWKTVNPLTIADTASIPANSCIFLAASPLTSSGQRYVLSFSLIFEKV